MFIFLILFGAWLILAGVVGVVCNEQTISSRQARRGRRDIDNLQGMVVMFVGAACLLGGISLITWAAYKL